MLIRRPHPLITVRQGCTPAAGLRPGGGAHRRGNRLGDVMTLLRSTRLTARIGSGLLMLLIASCSRTSSDGPGESVRSASSSSPDQLGPGAFRLESLDTTREGTSRYMASIGAAPATCRFALEIERSNPVADSGFSFARAVLRRQPGSDCTTLLSEAARRLGFSGELPRPEPVNELVGSLAIIGTNLSRSEDPGGGFSSEPTGNWTAMKLFLANDQAEVYLNISERDGVGEFSTKDETYATAVVTELAKVLLPASSVRTSRRDEASAIEHADGAARR